MSAQQPEEQWLFSAQPELIAMAVRMRPTWNADQLAAAIVSARQAGWPWERAFRAVNRLLLIQDSSPADLTTEVRRHRIPPPASSARPTEYADAKAAVLKIKPKPPKAPSQNGTAQ